MTNLQSNCIISFLQFQRILKKENIQKSQVQPSKQKLQKDDKQKQLQPRVLTVHEVQCKLPHTLTCTQDPNLAGERARPGTSVNYPRSHTEERTRELEAGLILKPSFFPLQAIPILSAKSVCSRVRKAMIFQFMVTQECIKHPKLAKLRCCIISKTDIHTCAYTHYW